MSGRSLAKASTACSRRRSEGSKAAAAATRVGIDHRVVIKHCSMLPTDWRRMPTTLVLVSNTTALVVEPSAGQLSALRQNSSKLAQEDTSREPYAKVYLCARSGGGSTTLWV